MLCQVEVWEITELKFSANLRAQHCTHYSIFEEVEQWFIVVDKPAALFVADVVRILVLGERQFDVHTPARHLGSFRVCALKTTN